MRIKSTKDRVLRSVAKIFDESTAYRLAELLADEQIPADVVDAPPLGFEVWVREDDFDRANAILGAAALTDEDLVYLATGDLGKGSSVT